ncbi:MAG: hypothetical protein ACOC6P_02455 [Candidatus Aminicenantaceae bacterium]
MDFVIKEVKTKRDLKTFIFLPEKLHANHPTWVPPIYSDEKNYFNPKKNDHFSYCDTILLLAWRGGTVIGRIMGIINHRYNKAKGVKTVRFSYLETEKEEEVIKALLDYIEQWGKEKGMTGIIGPYGFTDQDPEGFLIEGFEHRATIATNHNYPWMPQMVEKQGYKKDVDYYVYKIDIPEKIPDFFKKIHDRAENKGTYKLIQFQKRKELKPWIKPILQLMNECYTSSNIYGYTPLKEKEMEDLAKRYLPIIDPRFVKAVRKGDKLIAFIVGIPDMTKGIQEAGGKLFPFGFIKILRAAKKTKQLDLLLGGIKEKYQGKGLDALMGVNMLMSAKKAGFEFMDTHHELESNVKVRSTMEKMGGEVYKKFRVYKKKL